MKTVAIIGGGISGCVAAMYLAEKNCKVSIYEKTDKLGGILKDFKVDDNIFLPGPQYIVESKWSDKIFLNKNFKNLIKKNKYIFGSFTDLFNSKKIYIKNFAHPVNDLKFKKLNIKKKIKSLENRLNIYQSDISEPLKSWCKRFNINNINIETLHKSCCYSMQVGRIFFINDKNKTFKLKNRNKIADELLGIPGKKKYHNAYLPKKGFDIIFKKFNKYLKDLNVKLFFNKSIKIQNNKNREIFYGDKKIKADFYIWVCNPVPLISSSGLGKLDNPVVRVVTYFFDIETEEDFLSDEYYQIFSKMSSINRVYIYRINKKNKLNVECFVEKKIILSTLIKKIKIITQKFKIKILKMDFVGTKKEVRHILYTINDFRKISKFKSDVKNKKIIPGYWEVGSRQKKINNIIKQIDKKILKIK